MRRELQRRADPFEDDKSVAALKKQLKAHEKKRWLAVPENATKGGDAWLGKEFRALIGYKHFLRPNRDQAHKAE